MSNQLSHEEKIRGEVEQLICFAKRNGYATNDNQISHYLEEDVTKEDQAILNNLDGLFIECLVYMKDSFIEHQERVSMLGNRVEDKFFSFQYQGGVYEFHYLKEYVDSRKSNIMYCFYEGVERDMTGHLVFEKIGPKTVKVKTL